MSGTLIEVSLECYTDPTLGLVASQAWVLEQIGSITESITLTGTVTLDSVAVFAPNLPTADPQVLNQLYINGGVLCVSQG